MTGKNPKLLGDLLLLSDEELKMATGGESEMKGYRAYCHTCSFSTEWTDSRKDAGDAYMAHKMSNPQHDVRLETIDC